MTAVPTINVTRTGENIAALRKERGLSVREVQDVLGFHTPQAIFKWQRGECLPTLDNLVILAALFDVTIDEIVAVRQPK